MRRKIQKECIAPHAMEKTMMIMVGEIVEVLMEVVVIVEDVIVVVAECGKILLLLAAVVAVM